jgi:hypothetical protein
MAVEQVKYWTGIFAKTVETEEWKNSKLSEIWVGSACPNSP